MAHVVHVPEGESLAPVALFGTSCKHGACQEVFQTSEDDASPLALTRAKGRRDGPGGKPRAMTGPPL